MPFFDNAYALVIGINNYKYISHLNKAVNDARDVAAVLADENLCGYPPENVHCLTDNKATLKAFNQSMQWLAKAVNEQSIVTIFFSGHGAHNPEDDTQGYLLLSDSNPWSKDDSRIVNVKQLEKTAVSSRKFTATLNQLKAQKITIIFDACHSGGFASPRNPFFNRNLLLRGLPDQYLVSLQQGEGRVIIASCKPDQVSWEKFSMQNGIFTDTLLTGLRGEAAKEGGIHVDDLFLYLEKHVAEKAGDIIDFQTGRPAQQNPYLKAETTNNYQIALTSTRPVPEKISASSTKSEYDIFVSYSHEDVEKVDYLTRRLQEDGFRVWADEAELGGGDPLIRSFVDAIRNSSHVIPCLSKNFMTSKWTDFEGAVAQTMDINAQKRKLIPVRIDNCEIPSEYGWLYCPDLSGSIDTKKWEREYQKVIKNPKKTREERGQVMADGNEIVAQKAQSSVSVEDVADIIPAPREQLKIEFANQKKALWAIEQQLITEEPYVFITATAQMGKTYLLKELKRRCESGELNPNPTKKEHGPKKWHCACIDLKQNGKRIKNESNLISILLQNLNGSHKSSIGELARCLRDFEEKDDKRVLFLINATEYMTEDVAGRFHAILGEIEAKLAGTPQFIPGVVAVGRRSFDGWKNSYRPKMKSIELGPFTPGVIEDILKASMSPHRRKRRSNEWFKEYSQQIYQCTAGHPRCIAAMVQYLHDEKYTIAAPNSDGIFDKIIVPIIERYILTQHNLDGHEEARKFDYELLSSVFIELSLYRIITIDLIEAVITRLGFKNPKERLDALETHIDKSLLIKWDKELGWNVMPSSVRQLLARWSTTIHQDKTERNCEAAALYHSWLIREDGQYSRQPAQGDVQIAYIRESFFHFASSQENETDEVFLYGRLEGKLLEYCRNLRVDRGQRPGRMLRDQFHADAELHNLVDSIIGEGAYHRLIGATSEIL